MISPRRSAAMNRTASPGRSPIGNGGGRMVSPPQQRSSSTTTRAASAHAPTQAQYALMKVELVQRKAELESKRKQLGKLEAENLDLIRESESSRKREEERREALMAKHRGELESERKLNASHSKEAAELRNDIATLETTLHTTQEEVVRLRRTETKLNETEEILIDRSRRLEQLLVEKKDADEIIFKLRTNDAAKMLEGRLEALNSIVEEKDKTIHQWNQRNEEYEMKNRTLLEKILALEDQCADSERLRGQMEVTLRERDAAIERLNNLNNEAAARIVASEASARSALDTSAEQAGSLNTLVDELRSELRHQQKLVQTAELQLAEKDNEVQLVRSEFGAQEGRIHNMKNEINHLEDRLKKSHLRAEEKEAESAKEKVVMFELRGELSAKNATIDTLRQELLDASKEATRQRESIGELRSVVTKNEGVEDKLRVIDTLRARQAEENDAFKRQIEDLKAQLLESEEQAQRCVGLRKNIEELEAQLKTKSDAINLMLEEKAINATHFDNMKEELTNEKGKIRVLKVRLEAEEGRRNDMERKMSAMEAASLDTHTSHGKYLALQNFVQTSTNETAKAMELNTALIEEVRTLEGRSVTFQKQISELLEERREAEVAVAQGESAVEELQLAREKIRSQISQITELKERLVGAESRAADADLAEIRTSDVQGTLQSRTEELLLTKQQLTAAKEQSAALKLQLEASQRTNEELNTKLTREVEGRVRDRDESKAQSLREEIRYSELLQQLTKSHASMTMAERSGLETSNIIAEKDEAIKYLEERNEQLQMSLDRELQVRRQLVEDSVGRSNVVVAASSAMSPTRSKRAASPGTSSFKGGSPSSPASSAKRSTVIDLKNKVLDLQAENDILQKRLGQMLQSSRVEQSPSRRNASALVAAIPCSPTSVRSDSSTHGVPENELRAQLVDKMEEVALLNKQLESERKISSMLRRQLDELATDPSSELKAWKAECDSLQRENLKQQERYFEQEDRMEAMSGQLSRAMEELKFLQRTTTKTTGGGGGGGGSTSSGASSLKKTYSTAGGVSGAGASPAATPTRYGGRGVVSPIMSAGASSAAASALRTPSGKGTSRSVVINPETPEPSRNTPRRVGSAAKSQNTTSSSAHADPYMDPSSSPALSSVGGSPPPDAPPPSPAVNRGTPTTRSPAEELAFTPTPSRIIRGGASSSSSRQRSPVSGSIRARSRTPPTKKSVTAQENDTPSRSAATRAADAKAKAIIENAERSAAESLVLRQRNTELQAELNTTKDRLAEAFQSAHFSSPPHFSSSSALATDNNRREHVYSPPRPDL